MAKHPPKNLQAYLWSVSVDDLDIEKDKNYIIHQIFAYGGIAQWRWLFKTYSFKTILNVFLNQPAKIYRPDAFNFVKNILLSLKNENLNKENYVLDIPVRTISSKSDLIFQQLDDTKKSLDHNSDNKLKNSV